MTLTPKFSANFIPALEFVKLDLCNQIFKQSNSRTSELPQKCFFCEKYLTLKTKHPND